MNVKLNELQNKIIIINAGCGYDGKVKVREDLQTDISMQLIDYGNGIEVPVYSLNTIVWSACYAGAYIDYHFIFNIQKVAIS